RGPSRRQAVVALGAGLIGGTIDLSGQGAKTPPTKQATTAKPQPPTRPDPFKECVGKPTTEGYVDTGGKTQLQLSSCCHYVNDVLHQGYPNSRTESQAALKRFM